MADSPVIAQQETQRSISRGYETEAEAQAGAREMVNTLLSHLRSQGFWTFTAPPCPSAFNGICETVGDCRVLIAWLPPWAHSSDAGKFVCRVDTLASPRRIWTCPHCQAEQTDLYTCQSCERARYQSWDIMVSEHVLEHIADGLATPLEIQKAMNERPCYANIRGGFTLQTIVQRMRYLTTDTSELARKLLKAHAAVMALDVVKRGDTKDKLAALKGIQVLGDVVEHKGEVSTVVKHVYEEASPRRDDPRS